VPDAKPINPANAATASTLVRPAAAPAIDHFSIPRLRKTVFIIIALLLLNKLGTWGNLAFYAILFAWAFRTPEGALKAVAMSGLLITASDFFATKGAPVGPLKYLLLFVAGFTILRSVRNPLGQPFLVFTLLFGAVVALLSIYNGYFVGVSLLKVASFTYGAFTLMAIVQLRRNIAPEMLAWAFALTLAVLILSYGALLVGAGYGSYETIWGGRFSGYRGVFSHPQTLGVMACLFAVFTTSLLLFVAFPYRRLALIMTVGMLFLLYLSQARTGMIGYFLVIGFALVMVGLARNPPQERRLIQRYQRNFFALAFAGIVALFVLEAVTGKVSDRATRFIAKGEQVEELDISILYKSRETQIREAWENFKEHPMTGIGFGTDLSIHWQRKATLLSASTEKGFLPTGLLEEVGVVGMLFFLLFVFSLYGYTMRSRRYLGLAMVTALIVVNMGEMMFFAFGGMAMLCWPLIATGGTAADAQPAAQAVPTAEPARQAVAAGHPVVHGDFLGAGSGEHRCGTSSDYAGGRPFQAAECSYRGTVLDRAHGLAAERAGDLGRVGFSGGVPDSHGRHGVGALHAVSLRGQPPGEAIC
jgi:hypothetical protein